jgi:hypothetical protein
LLDKKTERNMESGLRKEKIIGAKVSKNAGLEVSWI